MLERLLQAGSRFRFTEIVRVCADSPFVDPQRITDLVAERSRWAQAIDYVGFTVDGEPAIGRPYGLPELVSYAWLAKQFRHVESCQEHATWDAHSPLDPPIRRWIELKTGDVPENQTVDTVFDLQRLEKQCELPIEK